MQKPYQKPRACVCAPPLFLTEFSKKVIIALCAAWFIGLAVGIFTVVWQTLRGEYGASLDGLLLFIGAPMTGGIVSYMIKSAEENKTKIRCQKGNEYESQVDVP